MSTTTDPARLLPDEMLARFDQRAAGYDRDNTFFQEDWDELRQSGYLLAAVPSDMGGAGLGLDEVSRLQSRLAYRAAPTALAVNMHLYWTGVAADLLRTGDKSCRWMLEKAAEGEGSRPYTAKPAMTSRCCCRPPRPSASTAAGGLQGTSCSVRCRRYGPTPASTPWTRPTHRPPGSSTASFPVPHQACKS